MTKEELEAILASTLKPITDEMATIKAGQAELGAKIEAGKELHAKVSPHAEKLRACAAAMQAAGIGVHQARGHAAILNRMADTMEAEAMTGSMPHIFRDHDYAGGSYYAGAEPKPSDKPTPEVEELKAQVAALTTKLNDGIAAARTESKEPERKTLSPQIMSLLAKAGVGAEGEKKITIADLDKVLAGKSISERIRMKTEFSRAGLLDEAA